VTIWGGKDTLQHLPTREWLDLAHVPALDGNLVARLRWQMTALPQHLRMVDILYAPSGTYTGQFRPYVAISRNMLPFQPEERRRYGVSWQRFRLFLLRVAQRRTFQRAAGSIFLTSFAHETIEAVTGQLGGHVAVIPHGVADIFRCPPRPASDANAPVRWLYVSTVNVYKHQWNVVEAVGRLRAQGLNVTLTLVGDGYGPSLQRLTTVMRDIDPEGAFVRYRPAVTRPELAALYRDADAFVFASTCENMPNILVEAMASGLPIVCSDRRPMPDVLGDAGLYCDVESIDALTAAMSTLSRDADVRASFACRAHAAAERFSWTRCADATFALIARAYETHARQST